MNWIAGILIAFALLIAGLQIFMRIRARRMRGAPVPALPKRFEGDMESGRPLVFYFHSPGCRACRAMTPLMKEIAGKNRNVFIMDASEDADTARRFGIMGTPSTIRVAEGKITDFLLGPQSREVLLELIQRDPSPSR